MLEFSAWNSSLSTEFSQHHAAETGRLYIIVSCLLFISLIVFYKNSPTISQNKKSLLLLVIGWMVAGLTLLTASKTATVIITFLGCVLCIRNLIMLFHTQKLIRKAEITLPSLDLECKSHQYFHHLQTHHITPHTLITYSQLNEAILWGLLLYKSALTFYFAFPA